MMIMTMTSIFLFWIRNWICPEKKTRFCVQCQLSIGIRSSAAAALAGTPKKKITNGQMCIQFAQFEQRAVILGLIRRLILLFVCLGIPFGSKYKFIEKTNVWLEIAAAAVTAWSRNREGWGVVASYRKVRGKKRNKKIKCKSSPRAPCLQQRIAKNK